MAGYGETRRFEVRITRELLDQLVVKEGRSFSEVARIASKTIGYISVQAKKFGIISTHLSKIASKPLPVQEMYDRYTAGASLDSLKKEYKAPVARIKKTLTKYKPDIIFRTMDEAKRPSELNNSQALVGYVAADKSFGEISRELGVKKATVINAYRRLERSGQFQTCVIPACDLRMMYWEKGMTIRSIAAEFGTTEKKITSLMESRHIPIRRAAEAGEVVKELDLRGSFASAEACYNKILADGFAPVTIDEVMLRRGLNNLTVPAGRELDANYNRSAAVYLIIHFSPHYYRSTHKDYMPISAAWEAGNRSVLKGAIEMLWTSDRAVSIKSITRTIGKYYKDFSPVSVFKPWVAAHIYDNYLPNGGTVVDPCMGWGGRLLGCVGRNIRYVGYDLNPNAIQSHTKLREFVGSQLGECSFNCADSSTADFQDGDLLFTSPPYDDCESYYGIDSSKTRTAPILENIFSKFSGIIALNVPKRQRDMVVDIAAKYSRKLSDELQMKTASFMGRESTYEPVLVFK